MTNGLDELASLKEGQEEEVNNGLDELATHNEESDHPNKQSKNKDVDEISRNLAKNTMIGDEAESSPCSDGSCILPGKDQMNSYFRSKGYIHIYTRSVSDIVVTWPVKYICRKQNPGC